MDTVRAKAKTYKATWAHLMTDRDASRNKQAADALQRPLKKCQYCSPGLHY